MSDRRNIETRIERLLRKTALRGSDRSIDWEGPIGAGGLGLDSLALVEFVIAFEKEFSVEVPEAIWSRLSEITPGWFVNLVAPADTHSPDPSRSRGLFRSLGKRWFRKPGDAET